VVRSTGNDRLMVGFNRRFAPLLADLRDRFGESPAGTTLRYLVTAGPLLSGSWYSNEHLEGSRFAGEGGHFLDTIGWWMGGLPVELQAIESGGTLHVMVRYEQARLGTIDYVTAGSPRYPKETFDVSAAGRSARFENFSRATVWHGRRRRTRRALVRDKGQQRELARFVDAVRSGSPMPIPLSSLVSTTAATLAVSRSLEAGSPVPL
jgi:predicted dehydrogenase